MAVTCSALQAAGLPCSQADRAGIANWLAANPSHGHKIVKPSLAAWGLYDGAKEGATSFTERVAAAERVLAAGDAPKIGEGLLRFMELVKRALNERERERVLLLTLLPTRLTHRR